MVGSSKILTVSYGTFSCTLEGFDESFETMKAIAEYFRDLAADDRYFGAEPPTPDAEMLARIAEREIARRVEAREHEGRIVLRAQEEAAPATALAPMMPKTAPDEDRAADEEHASNDEGLAGSLAGEGPAPEAEMAPNGEVARETAETSDAETPAPVAEADTGVEAMREPTAEEAPAPEWAVATESDTTPEMEPAVADASAPETDDHPAAVAGADAAASSDGADMAGVQDTADVAASTMSKDTADADVGDGGVAAPISELAVAETPIAQTRGVEADDLTARLALIRSVVGESDTYDEDEHAQDFLNAPDMDASATWDDMADMAPGAETVAETGMDTPSETDDDGPSGPDDAGAARSDWSEQEDSAFEDTLAALLADAAPDDAQTVPAANPEAEAAEAAEVAETDEAGSDGGEEPRRARVVKVSRTDLEAAQAEGLIEAADENGEDTVNIFGDEAEVLSPEDEAELQRELASLDAELGAEIGPQDEIETSTTQTASMPHQEPEHTPADDAEAQAGSPTEMARIFTETDTQMTNPGSVRRRNTIQHLRAALAATRAEKAAGKELTRKVDPAPYRGDLGASVRPRRAISAPDTPRHARPEEPRPAPLKLVAEQRVDTPRDPIRPRRVRTPQADDVLEAHHEAFPAFAAELGVTDLPELLEAAAAYLADVEDREQFSRPMLMGKLREIDAEGFSREDGLRSFGQLLREGKLRKLSGGRFAVTEETEFRAAARRLAG